METESEKPDGNRLPVLTNNLMGFLITAHPPSQVIEEETVRELLGRLHPEGEGVVNYDTDGWRGGALQRRPC